MPISVWGCEEKKFGEEETRDGNRPDLMLEDEELDGSADVPELGVSTSPTDDIGTLSRSEGEVEVVTEWLMRCLFNAGDALKSGGGGGGGGDD